MLCKHGKPIIQYFWFWAKNGKLYGWSGVTGLILPNQYLD